MTSQINSSPGTLRNGVRRRTDGRCTQRERSGEAPLPLRSLRDDVANAGGVIAETRSGKVKALVYLAALAPDEGETVTARNWLPITTD
jgi:hypothetical protein